MIHFEEKPLPKKRLVKPLTSLTVIGPPQKRVHLGKICLFLHLSDDQWYRVSEIVDVILKKRLPRSTLDMRLRDYGWEYPYLFYPKAKKGYSIDGVLLSGCNSPSWKGGVVAKPAKTDPNRLSIDDIPGPGLLEIKYLSSEVINKPRKKYIKISETVLDNLTSGSIPVATVHAQWR